METTQEIEKTKFSDYVQWTPKQRMADIALKDYKYLLYGGAVGGGKSYWLRWEGIKLLMYYFNKYGLRGITGGLFCEDYPALKDRHLSKIKFEFPPWLGEYHAQDHNFVLAPEYGSGILALRNLDDVSKYQSSEFAFEAVDELTKNQKETFDFLRTRLRWPGIEDTKFFAGTNPGSVGHGWVKSMWIDKVFDENEQEPEKFFFIPAKATDNPHIPQSYYKSLESLPEALRKAFLEGDWDLFKGQYFSEWRRDIHVCAPFQIPNDWKKFIAIDYGFSAPASVGWYAVSPDKILYRYRELYIVEQTFSDLTKLVIAMTPESEEIRYWVADPSIWAKKGESVLSGAEIMEDKYREIKKKTLMLLQGNNDRLNGWRVMREYLKPFMQEEKITARLQIFSTCENFIRTVPSLVYDPIRVEDLDSDGEDHCLAGDTLVDTDRGQIMIKDLVGQTGKVWTQKGLSYFDNVAQTKWNTDLVKLDLKNGKSIIATPEHRILTQRGWVEIQNLDIRFDDVIQLGICITLLQKQSKNLRGKGIIFAVNTFREKVKDYMLLYGYIIMAKFQKVFMSIIKISTDQIIESKILSLSPDMNICLYTLKQKKQGKGQEKVLNLQDRSQSNGINQRQEGYGTEYMQKKVGKVENILKRFVNNVAKNILQDISVHQGFVTKTVKREPYGQGDAYNLRVPNVFHFSVNGGLIVHNSADECRYGMMSEPVPAATPDQIKEKLFKARMKANKKKSNRPFRMVG